MVVVVNPLFLIRLDDKHFIILLSNKWKDTLYDPHDKIYSGYLLK